MPKTKDLTGQRFGRLTVVKQAGSRRDKQGRKGNAIWLTVCDCGSYKEVLSSNLLRGLTKSCGCLQIEISTKIAIRVGHSQVGKNHPNWQGGKSFEPYCFRFNKDLKEHIRNKFDRHCILCGTDEHSEKMHVHHIDYNKGQGCGHSWNLVPLCRSCHMRTNFNRWYWFNLLNSYWTYKYIGEYLC